MAYIERKNELNSRRQRKDKLRKVKAKFAKAKTPTEKEEILQKLLRISPTFPLASLNT